MGFNVQIVKSVDQINVARLNDFWGSQSATDRYDLGALKNYLKNEDSYLLAATDTQTGDVVGLLLATILRKPYKSRDYLYIDEVDTHPDHYRNGIASALVREALKIAKSKGIKEVWVATEPDNLAARKLYESLKPDSIDDFVGFTLIAS